MESTLEDMTGLAAADVENLPIQAVQSLHTPRQVRFRGPDQKVEMVRHVDVGEDLPLALRGDLVHPPEVKEMVVGVEKDRLAAIASRGDVVDGAGRLDAKRTRHRSNVATSVSRGYAAGGIGTVLSHPRLLRGQTP